jgi:FkbM family methyltransferase
MNKTKRCRWGEMIYRPNDKFIGRSFDLYGEFSEGEVRLFRALVRPGQTVLDVGANIGAHTVPLARFVGPTGSVLAFEPQRTLFYMLCGNVAQNNLDHVKCFQAAVGERAGQISVPELDPAAEQNYGGVDLSRPVKGPAATVPLLRIDDLRLAACHLIKIDVEGMEREVLLGAADTIRRLRPLLYVEDDRPDKSAALRACLASFGYELWFHVPPLFDSANFAGNKLNVFSNIVSANVFAFPGDAPPAIQPREFGMVKIDAPAPDTATPAAAPR